MVCTKIVEVTMETVDTVIFRAMPEIRSKLKSPDEARTYNFVYELLMIVAYGSFWKRIKTLQDHRNIMNRPTKKRELFLFVKIHARTNR